jgi:signal transduction histidine kinase/CheY-like chemotaxis protein
MTGKVEHLRRKVILGYISIAALAVVASVHVFNLVTRIVEEEKRDNPAREKASVITKTLLFLYESESLTQFIGDEDEDFTLFNQTLDSVSWQLHRMESYSPDSSMLEKIDGLELLLDEKRENTRLLMEARREMNRLYSKYISDGMKGSKSPAKETEVQKEEDTLRSTVVVQRQRKGFLKRLAEAFVPVRSDTALVTNSTTRMRTDSLINEYNPSDTIARVLKNIQAGINREYELLNAQLNRRIDDLRYNNSVITGRIGQILFEIEDEDMFVAMEQEAAKGEIVGKALTRLAVITVISLLIIVVFMYRILRDISRSRYYRRQLEDARKFAEDLLQSREKFMLMISHDLRAPLSSILGYIELLKQSCRGESPGRYLDNISVLSGHILSLVNDLLDFHRLESGKMTIRPVPFNLAVLFDEIYAGFRPLTDSKGLTFVLDKGAVTQDAVYEGDPIRIRQAVGNLISNAVKFTPEGSVYLSVSSQPADCPGEDRILISVKDEGPGIRESEQELIFREFTRLAGSETTEGFGLGLSIACKLASLMGGSISLDSTLGEGSVFTITLLLKRSEEALPTPQAAVTERCINCLAIDDDIVQLRLTEELLKRNGINVTALSDPNDALALLKTTASFDIILTDMQMPLFGGYELLRRIRALEAEGMKSIPVVALSASLAEEPERYLEAGFGGFLNKPFAIEELIALIDKLLPQEPQPSADGPLNVAALTAFAGDDTEAAASILRTFSEETQKSLALLQEALDGLDRLQASAVSHKLIPLFTMLEAGALVAQLRILEANEDTLDESLWKQILADIIQRITSAVRQINVE